MDLASGLFIPPGHPPLAILGLVLRFRSLSALLFSLVLFLFMSRIIHSPVALVKESLHL